jgi:hypothetical protein
VVYCLKGVGHVPFWIDPTTVGTRIRRFASTYDG